MYGTFTFSYQPPNDATSEDTRVEMSFSSEADMPTILKHFGNFLRANGYPLDFENSLEVSRDTLQVPNSHLDSAPYFLSDNPQNITNVPEGSYLFFDNMGS